MLEGMLEGMSRVVCAYVTRHVCLHCDVVGTSLFFFFPEAGAHVLLESVRARLSRACRYYYATGVQSLLVFVVGLAALRCLLGWERGAP